MSTLGVNSLLQRDAVLELPSFKSLLGRAEEGLSVDLGVQEKDDFMPLILRNLHAQEVIELHNEVYQLLGRIRHLQQEVDAERGERMNVETMASSLKRRLRQAMEQVLQLLLGVISLVRNE